MFCVELEDRGAVIARILFWSAREWTIDQELAIETYLGRA